MSSSDASPSPNPGPKKVSTPQSRPTTKERDRQSASAASASGVPLDSAEGAAVVEYLARNRECFLLLAVRWVCLYGALMATHRDYANPTLPVGSWAARRSCCALLAGSP